MVFMASSMTQTSGIVSVTGVDKRVLVRVRRPQA